MPVYTYSAMFCLQTGFLIPLSIPDGDACYDDKTDIAELNGLQETADFVLHPDKPPSNELMAFLRLINTSGDLRRLQQFRRLSLHVLVNKLKAQCQCMMHATVHISVQ